MANATFVGSTQPEKFVVSVDVVLSSNKTKFGNFMFRMCPGLEPKRHKGAGF